MRRLAALLVGLIVIVSGCSNNAQEALGGTNWQLIAVVLQQPVFNGIVPVAVQPNYTLAFHTDNTFDATADCNKVSGTWSTKGNFGVTLVPGPSTTAYCGEDSYGTLYVHSLSAITGFGQGNDQLTLTLSSGGSLQFTTLAPGATAAPLPSAFPTPTLSGPNLPLTEPNTSPGDTVPLTSKTWQLANVAQSVPPFEDTVPAGERAKYTITFSPDMSAVVKADCNNVTGTYKTPDPNAVAGSLTLQASATTLAICPAGSLSDVYLSVLADVTGYHLAENQLILTRANGGTMVFE